MGKRDEGRGADQNLMRALAHPLRVEILRILSEEPSSPVRLSALLGEQLGNVSYHTKVLVDRGCIELVETRPARGAVEHIYRAKSRATHEGSSLTCLPLTVDEQGWREIEEILGGIEERLQAVGERCSTRLRDADGGSPIVVAVAAFEGAVKGGGDK